MHVQYCSSFIIHPLYFNVNCITAPQRYASSLAALCVAERILFACAPTELAAEKCNQRKNLFSAKIK